MSSKVMNASWWLPLVAVGLLACSDDDNGPRADAGSDSGADAASGPTTFAVRLENVSMAKMFTASGVFDTPVDAAGPGPLLPGDSYEVTFKAPAGAKLSFATMFVQSNDWFYAPAPAGIPLFSEGSGMPTSGDVTSQVKLWDAGTEVDQAPGEGADQAPRQGGPDTGAADSNSNVREVSGGGLPAVADVIKVTLTPGADNTFTLAIENVSDSSTLETSGDSVAVPLAPGVYVVHTDDAPLFTAGEADTGKGLEALAEDGDASTLGAYLAQNSGLTSIIAPGVWAVHATGMPLFQMGQPDRGEGLEALAEDGDPSALATAVGGDSDVASSGVFDTPAGQSSAGPVLPGGAYEFSVTAEPGDRLSLATMFVQSNDLFYAPADSGLVLFDSAGMPVSGAVTTEFRLWDAGTEGNQEPGIGPDQAPRQSGPNTGASETANVIEVSDGFSYPAVVDVLQVTLTPQ